MDLEAKIVSLPLLFDYLENASDIRYMKSKKLKHFYINKYFASPFFGGKYRLYYDYYYKVLWFRVAKVATRTILQHFLDNTPEDKYIYSSETGFLNPLHKDFFKFAFVRNPVDRFLSAWKEKVLKQNYFGFSKKMHHEMQNLENFISWTEDLNIETCDVHLRAQSSLIDLNNVDFIGRFENFKEDFQFLAYKINLPMKTIHRKNTTKNMNYYFDKSQKERVRKIYTKDCQIFYPE